jgi:release factor glutamine methyltransferase
MPDTVASLLADRRLPALETRMLLGRVLGRDRAWLAAHPEAVVPDDAALRFRGFVARRLSGEPMAYLTGEREFFSLVFHVTPAVLIPRQETEVLVEQALALIPAGVPARVADLGTGSGAIALALAHHRPQARIVATDVSATALAVAQDNARRLGLPQVRFVHSEWCADLPDPEYEVIVSNPPYVAEHDRHLSEGDVRHEPRGALASGRDGLADLRIIARQAPKRLAAGGWLLVEHGYDQGEAVRGLFGGVGLAAVETIADLAGIGRVTKGRKR